MEHSLNFNSMIIGSQNPKKLIAFYKKVLLDSWEANIKFYQLLLKTSGYTAPSRKQIEGIFHLSMMDAIRVLANESSEEKVRKVWEMGRGRKVRYPIELLKIPEHAGDVVDG